MTTYALSRSEFRQLQDAMKYLESLEKMTGPKYAKKSPLRSEFFALLSRAAGPIRQVTEAAADRYERSLDEVDATTGHPQSQTASQEIRGAIGQVVGQIRQDFWGRVEQVAGRDICNQHHHTHLTARAEPPADSEVAVECPQCGGRAWRYSQHCMHCHLDLPAWSDSRRRAKIKLKAAALLSA